MEINRHEFPKFVDNPATGESIVAVPIDNISPSEAVAASAMVILARLILVILICVLLIKLRTPKSDISLAHLKLPPGPMGLPILGYLPFVSKEIHLTLTSLSEKYGPIYQIFLGGIRVVVLNDASLVRQAFKQPVFSGRPNTQLTRILQGYGIVNSEGALWKEQRAFLHSALRKLGAKSLMSGSNGLEAKIQVSVRSVQFSSFSSYTSTSSSFEQSFCVREVAGLL